MGPERWLGYAKSCMLSTEQTPAPGPLLFPWDLSTMSWELLFLMSSDSQRRQLAGDITKSPLSFLEPKIGFTGRPKFKPLVLESLV